MFRNWISSIPFFRHFQRMDGVIVGLCSLFVCLLFFYQYWWGPDDGGYAYVAQLVLEGKILHRDIQDIHPDLIHFTNAFFLWLAKGDLIGLRWPLVVMTAVQSCLVFQLLKRYGVFVAFTAAACMTAFGFLQFINPTPHWYTLFLTTIIVYSFSNLKPLNFRSLVWVGFLVGVCFLFRQLTGVILAVAVTNVLFLKLHSEQNEKNGITGAIILLFLAAALGFYIFRSAQPVGMVLIGVYPPLILMLSARAVRLSYRHVAKIIFPLLVGSLIAATPIFVYHIVHGSFVDWLNDVFVTPFTLVALPFFSKESFLFIPLLAIGALAQGDINGGFGLLYWLPLLLAPACLGIANIIQFVKTSGKDIHALPIVASFYALISIHYEIPIYLMYSSGLVLVAILFIASTVSVKNFPIKNLATIFVFWLCLVALLFHVAPSVNQNYYEKVTHKRHFEKTKPLPGQSVYVNARHSESYYNILNLINTCSERNDSIYAFPMNAELYFLSGRKPPVNYFMSSLGLKNEDDVREAKQKFIGALAPTLIFHKTDDKYNTPLALNLLDEVMPLYQHLGEREGFSIYQKNEHSTQQQCLHAIRGV